MSWQLHSRVGPAAHRCHQDCAELLLGSWECWCCLTFRCLHLSLYINLHLFNYASFALFCLLACLLAYLPSWLPHGTEWILYFFPSDSHWSHCNIEQHFPLFCVPMCVFVCVSVFVDWFLLLGWSVGHRRRCCFPPVVLVMGAAAVVCCCLFAFLLTRSFVRLSVRSFVCFCFCFFTYLYILVCYLISFFLCFSLEASRQSRDPHCILRGWIRLNPSAKQCRVWSLFGQESRDQTPQVDYPIDQPTGEYTAEATESNWYIEVGYFEGSNYLAKRTRHWWEHCFIFFHMSHPSCSVDCFGEFHCLVCIVRIYYDPLLESYQPSCMVGATGMRLMIHMTSTQSCRKLEQANAEKKMRLREEALRRREQYNQQARTLMDFDVTPKPSELPLSWDCYQLGSLSKCFV